MVVLRLQVDLPCWVGVIVCAASSCAAYQAVPAGRNLHAYFGEAEDLAFEDDSQYVVDGSPLPVRFSLPISPSGGPPAIDFVLVRPQAILIDSLELRVERPFYVAASELSNGQAASLDGVAADSDYLLFVRKQLVALGILDPEVVSSIDDFSEWLGQNTGPEGSVAPLSIVLRYLLDPDKPALGIDLERASQYALTLSWRRTMLARIPSIAEWYLSMQGGHNGDWWDDPTQTIAATGVMAFPTYLQELARTTSGTVNPVGLFHTIGNARELVMPTPIERSFLQQHYGPFARRPQGTDLNLAEPFLLYATTTVRVGGSVRSKFEHINSELQLSHVIEATQGVECNGLAFEGGDTGLRLVIECPPGTTAR